jgi:membrane protein YdbS with pleckstrin-like domain
MSFVNSTVDPALLPHAAEVALIGVQPSYRKLLRTEWAITSLFLVVCAVLVIVFTPEARTIGGLLLTIGAALLIIIFYYYVQERSFPFIAYAVREHDVMFRSGWLVRSIKVCPYNRVQNCSIKSGPLERRWGLASLVLYTAGSEGADMRIPGLLQQEAEDLRQFILSSINGTTGV